ncbi:Oidioi.mRNA.OKI2018_I69.chr1.g3151.t1.cds [Oikopleura dioica]|uniref:Oidioi.mRNA.OKI2018_I69.chr1.g3151.t1.cds n=1 Tax=Oikopleura dioica TaxID=34765 RepID=A0ABN7STA2_OIKDI|nr:Oidioi.mRNA.OKI2018_I69.chr1.g3151.t1.cds [Oikopleura dioica]
MAQALKDSLLDFNKVRAFQEFCGIRECKEDDPRGEDAIVSESQPERKARQQSARFRATKPWLHEFFMLGSVFGTEIFYITYLPLIFWGYENWTGRRLVQIWVITMYIGQVLKEFCQMPRPTSPPAFPMEPNFKAEFGFPSTHSIAGASLAFGTLLSICGTQDAIFPFALLVATAFTAWVALSRLYKGMHSILDILGGLAISALYLFFGWQHLDKVDHYIRTVPFSPIICLASNFVLGWFYPNGDCPSRKDTIIILGVGAGVNIANWLNYKQGLDYDIYDQPEWHIIFFRVIHGLLLTAGAREVAKTAMKSLLSKVFGPITSENIRKQAIEVPLQYFTYTFVGFTAVYLAPLLFLNLGLYR